MDSSFRWNDGGERERAWIPSSDGMTTFFVTPATGRCPGPHSVSYISKKGAGLDSVLRRNDRGEESEPGFRPSTE